jgi:hypothetical protein
MDRECGMCEIEKNSYRILAGKPEGRKHLDDLDTDGKIMLKLILKK